MTPRLLALAPLPLLIAACTPDPAAEAARTQAALDAAPAATVLGPGQNCVDRSQVRHTVVRSDRVIDFEMNGGKVYRSTLPSRCPGLEWDRAITYETSINQLCTQQIVYSLQRIGNSLQRGAGCSLGEFVPIEYVKE
ncbi:MAG: hypothetical protein NBV68_06725 [Erythrobacter sp.]|uniref:hypothetical protein n=1 Tax=Erythrobacter sp. TaxID=1042 RepID=UPI0025E6BCCA|nr:hypothetical protein [Erythrobacter sp.]MCL9999058.1 hypothetical protein [Erythrobacter sp.]